MHACMHMQGMKDKVYAHPLKYNFSHEALDAEYERKFVVIDKEMCDMQAEFDAAVSGVCYCKGVWRVVIKPPG